MTQTHPTSEVAVLVPTRGEKNLSAAFSSRPIRFSPKTVLIHQEEKKSFSLGLTTHQRFHAGGQ